MKQRLFSSLLCPSLIVPPRHRETFSRAEGKAERLHIVAADLGAFALSADVSDLDLLDGGPIIGSSMSLANQSTDRLGAKAAFATTEWSVVLEARDGSEASAGSALAGLCQRYWHPLYLFVRRNGYSAHDAEDLTQEFFARFIARDFLNTVHPENGRFRSFLLACLKHFLANEWKRERRQKRGGGAEVVRIDAASSELLLVAEARSELPPEASFDRRWALTILDRAMAALRAERVNAGKLAEFEALKIFLSSGENLPAQAPLAERLGMTPTALKMAVSRLRRRFADLLRAEVAATVSRPQDIDDEVRYLVNALR